MAVTAGIPMKFHMIQRMADQDWKLVTDFPLKPMRAEGFLGPPLCSGILSNQNKKKRFFFTLKWNCMI